MVLQPNTWVTDLGQLLQQHVQLSSLLVQLERFCLLGHLFGLSPGPGPNGEGLGLPPHLGRAQDAVM